MSRFSLGNGRRSVSIAALFLAVFLGYASMSAWAASAVYSFGSNAYGQLGTADLPYRTEPAKIDTLPTAAAAVSGGYSDTLILLQNGDVYACGPNVSGELGLGDRDPRLTPAQIVGVSGAAAVSMSVLGYHSLILLGNGEAYACGDNGAGQLGLGDTASRLTPSKIPSLSGAVAVSAGGAHSLVLLGNGVVYSFGDNSSGQLGLGDALDRLAPTKIPGLSGAVAVAAGYNHSLVLLGNGDVYSFGENEYGQLGLGDTSDRTTPTKISTLSGAVGLAAGMHSLVLLGNGDVYAFGTNFCGELGLPAWNLSTPTKIPGLSDVAAVSAGCGMGNHSLVMLGNGDVYSFGGNEYGQLGQGDTIDRAAPTKIDSLSGAAAVSAGDTHSLVLLESGEVYSFGWNDGGRLGTGDISQRTAPTRIDALSDAVGASAGWLHSLVILGNGDVYSFGDNSSGQLGLGDDADRFVPTRIAGLSDALAVAAGGAHSLVLLGNGYVYSFGGNSSGQLGLGDATDRHVPTRIPGLSSAVAVVAGYEHSLVLLANGDVFAFGRSEYGQLGHGDTSSRSTPTKIAGLSGAVAVAAGHKHSLVLLANGDVYSFGANSLGQLGHGDTVNRSTPTKIASLFGVSAIAAGGLTCAGGSHSLAVLGKGDVYAFGDNCWGQLGQGDFAVRSTPTRVASLSNAVSAAAGSWHSLVLSRNGDVYSFGRGSSGQLGHGDTEFHSTPQRIATLSSVVAVAAGRSHSLAITETPPADTPAVFRVEAETGHVFADGAYSGAAFFTGFADVAEWAPVSEVVAAGALLELDPVHPGSYRLSQGSCSDLVAGVVSSEPGVVLGGTEPAEGKALLALSGIVPVKVTNEGGPIQPGDLLVSSSTPGYAMRWAGPDPCPCALVGKALEPMTDERGVISALLTAH